MALKPRVMAHAFNSSTQERKTAGSSSELSWLHMEFKVSWGSMMPDLSNNNLALVLGLQLRTLGLPGVFNLEAGVYPSTIQSLVKT